MAKENQVNEQSTINNFGSLKFDKKYVKTKMDEFKTLNPNATAEQLSRAEKTFVANDVVLKVRLGAFDRTDHSRLSEQRLEETRTKVGIYVKTLAHSEMNFFFNYDGTDFADRLIAYQNTYSKADHYEETSSAIDSEYKPLLHYYSAKKANRAAEIFGNKYERGLFDPETDSKGVRLSDFSSISKNHLKAFNGWTEELENALKEAQEEKRKNDAEKDPTKHSKEKQNAYDKLVTESAEKAMRANQKEVDATKIPVPENMTPTLIRYAVLGETLSNENIDKTSACLNDGSTIISTIDARDNYKILFFESMYADDVRINTHSGRAVLPEARRTVKTLAENGDTVGLTARIQNSFNILYASLNGAMDPHSNLWNYQMRSLLSIVKDSREHGIDLQLDDAKKEKIRIFERQYALIKRMNKLEEDISEAGQKFILSEGADKMSDPKENPELFDKFIELETYQTLLSVMKNELQELDGNVYHNLDPKEYSKSVANREFTHIEKMWSENEKGLFSAFRDVVLKFGDTKKFLDANTFEEKKETFWNEKKEKIGIGFVPEQRLFGNVDLFERLVGDYPMRTLQEDVTEIIRKLNVNAEKIDDGLRRKQLNALNPIPGQIRKIQEIRSKMDFSEGADQYDRLTAEYGKLARYVNSYIGTDMKLFQSGFAKKHMPAMSVYSGYGKMIKDWRESKSFLNMLGRDVKEYGENRKTLFEQTFEENKHTFDTISAPETRTNDEKNFYDAFMKVKTCLDEANKKDPEETQEQRENRNREVRYAYRDCVNKAEGIEKSGSTDAMKFFAKNLRRAMDSEETKIVMVSDNRTVSFREAFEPRLFLNSLDEELLRKRLKDTLDELEKVSTRFPKNSEEFDRMLTSARKLADKDQPMSELLVHCRILHRTAQKYITAKSVFPSTEKGQKRLLLAKTFRDLCGANLAAMQKDRDYIMRPEKDAPDIAEDSRHSVEIKMENAARRLKKQAENEKTGPLMISELSRTLYLKKVYDSMEKNGPEKTAEMMEINSVNKAMEKLRPMTEIFVEETGTDEVAKIAQTENGIESLGEAFATFSKQNVVDNIKDNVEKKEDILPEKEEVSLDM